MHRRSRTLNHVLIRQVSEPIKSITLSPLRHAQIVRGLHWTAARGLRCRRSEEYRENVKEVIGDEVRRGLSSPPSAARRFNPEHVLICYFEAGFRRELDLLTAAQQSVAAGLSRLASLHAIGAALAAVGEDGHFGGREESEFAHDAVSTVVTALAARALTNAIAIDA